MKTFSDYLGESRRTEKDIDSGEIGRFISDMINSVNRYKRSNLKSADLYEDYILKGKFVAWLEANVVPVWEKHGYPEVGGSAAWGKFQREVIKTFFLDKASGGV